MLLEAQVERRKCAEKKFEKKIAENLNFIKDINLHIQEAQVTPNGVWRGGGNPARNPCQDTS